MIVKKKDTPRVSVIVPVYNVEKYVERCVRSLFEQTLEDMEYIFVNDCTPDRSMEIIKMLMEEYPRRRMQVKIVGHTKNQGSAMTRNSGLKMATGEYVIYCDSDDWVEKTMYEDMLQEALRTDADILGTDFYDDYGRRSKIMKQKFPENNIECVSRMLEGKLHCSTCNKLIRRDLFSREKIIFPEKVNMWEDVVTIVPLCFFADRIVYLPEAYYHYVHDNSASYTREMTRESLNNLITATAFLEKFFRDRQVYGLFEKKLRYLKLTVKLNLLIGSRGEQQKRWNRLYAEANNCIISYWRISFYWRIALLFAAWNVLSVFNLMVILRRKL